MPGITTSVSMRWIGPGWLPAIRSACDRTLREEHGVAGLLEDEVRQICRIAASSSTTRTVSDPVGSAGWSPEPWRGTAASPAKRGR